MNRSFIYALTGYSNGYTLYPELNSFLAVSPGDTKAQEVRTLLGTEDEYWAVRVASLVESQHLLTLNEPEIEDDVVLEAKELVQRQSEKLGSDMHGPANIIPATIEPEQMPLSRKIYIQYDAKHKIITIFAWGKKWIRKGYYVNSRLHINWPKELGIRGALLIADSPTTIELEVSVPYPVNFIANHLSQNETFFSLLTEIQYVHTFFYADTAAEKISVAAWALYKYINKK